MGTIVVNKIKNKEVTNSYEKETVAKIAEVVIDGVLQNETKGKKTRKKTGETKE